jgi:hypothetical protein
MDTNSTRPPPPSPSVVKALLWALLWLCMWFWAIVGPLFVVLAAISFFVDLSPYVSLTGFDGEEVRTTRQKAIFLVVNAVLGLVGITFVWLCRRGRLKGPV